MPSSSRRTLGLVAGAATAAIAIYFLRSAFGPAAPPPAVPTPAPTTAVQSHRFFLPSENRYVRLKVSARGIKTIDKNGIEAVVAEMRKRGEKV